MASVVKTRSKRGMTCRADSRDADRRCRSIRGFEYRPQARKAADQIGRLERLRKRGRRPDDELSEWIPEIPAVWQQRLVAAGRSDSTLLAASKPLTEHIDDFHAARVAKGASRAHAELLKGRAGKNITGCGFTHYADISGGKVAAYVARLRDGTPDAAAVSQPVMSPHSATPLARVVRSLRVP